MKNYKKVIFVDCLIVDPADLHEVLCRRPCPAAGIDGIPTVIDPKKAYPKFDIITDLKCYKDKKIVLIGGSVIGSGLTKVRLEINLKYEYFSHEEILNAFLPSSVKAPKSFQVIGKIIHLNLDDDQARFKRLIGRVLLDKIKGIDTVVVKKGSIDTEFRHPCLEVIAGKGVLETVHLENGLRFFVDYAKVYWNSRLQGERARLLHCFKEGDVIFDPFCGVGSLAIQALKKGCRVYCNDLNPTAIECLRKNIVLNNIDENRVVVWSEDAGRFLSRFIGCRADYFVLNLPDRSLEFVEHLKGFNRDAMLCCYFFCRDGADPKGLLRSKLTHATGDLCVTQIRNVSPTKKMYRLEAKLADIL